MTTESKYRLIAAAATLVLCALFVVWLVVTRLGYGNIAAENWPPKPDTTAVLLADEYMEVEMLPPVEAGGGSELEEGASAPAPEAQDLTNEGTPAEAPAPVITSTQPSPVKVKPVETPPKPTGPSQAEIEAQKARERREKEARDEAANRVKFGPTAGAKGSGDGTQGTGDGNSSQKSSYAGSGSGSVGGRGISVGRGVTSSVPGTVTVRISVSPEGKVISAELGTPTTIADPTVRQKCISLAKSAKIAADPSKTSPENGRITFIFK
ncbi:MAG: hypothetical protein NC111_00720 [Bacteroides sp.]|nr:hypothetical protein [Bacteroides sp.]MCM1413850.1 hypothetical protein [Bacteroides sp.]MCM1471041.1 hypothetical protein [Bacteroides sp.]